MRIATTMENGSNGTRNAAMMERVRTAIHRCNAARFALRARAPRARHFGDARMECASREMRSAAVMKC
eukprot:626320-Lingulodinium_polyedra.AAC.1